MYALSLFLCSTICGRIDQVNQLLELDQKSKDTARYHALDRWTIQLASLQQSVGNKMAWALPDIAPAILLLKRLFEHNPFHAEPTSVIPCSPIGRITCYAWHGVITDWDSVGWFVCSNGMSSFLFLNHLWAGFINGGRNLSRICSFFCRIEISNY